LVRQNSPRGLSDLLPGHLADLPPADHLKVAEGIQVGRLGLRRLLAGGLFQPFVEKLLDRHRLDLGELARLDRIPTGARLLPDPGGFGPGRLEPDVDGADRGLATSAVDHDALVERHAVAPPAQE
jgi:hypothetical protein